MWGCVCVAGSAQGRDAREHLKGLVTVFGPRLSSVTSRRIRMQIPGLVSRAQHREPSTALWSCQCLEFEGGSMAGKSAGLCQRDVLSFHFSPISCCSNWMLGGLRFQPASASETLSTPKGLSQLFEERICVTKWGTRSHLRGGRTGMNSEIDTHFRERLLE